ncbi:MAG: RraA family protein [Alphaproteobacteria bacterium]|nr:RraA family protein [Alphaproteobacteria bacterium]
MTNKPLNRRELAALAKFDTPTICNAIEELMPSHSAFGFTSKPLVCARPELGSMVGYAVTATIRAMQPADCSPEEMSARMTRYYEHMASGPRPGIVVIEDLDPQPGYGAWWGEVHTNVHKGLGCAGTITNGSIRDLPLCASGFQMLAGLVGPSHAHVHAVASGITVTVAGMTVSPGDLVHADMHGAVVIPHEIARRIPAVVAKQMRREAVIITAAKAKGFTPAKLAAAGAKASRIH